MKAIVVVDENWNIGKDGKLLVHLSGDLKYFKEKTLGKTIVIGRKTLESFPGGKPLPDRENIVLTRNMAYEHSDCIVCHSREDVMKRIEGKEAFIAGGAEVYKQFMDSEVFFVTKIYRSFDADRSFPSLDRMDGMHVVWKSEIQEENEIQYQFFEYRRK